MRAFLTRVVGRGLLAVMGLLAATQAACAQVAPKATFSKQALGPNGQTLTGPLHPGDVVNFVLSYDYGNAPAGSVTISDQLSPSLTYVDPSVSAVGWTYPLVPYSVGNQETYTNAGPGPAKSFTINVPVANVSQQLSSTAGDGFIPIPVGNSVYGIHHHLDAPNAKIMCWELLSLVPCSSWTVPRSIGPDLMTPTLVRHLVIGKKIFFPTAQVAGSGVTATTTPGIGCWDTTTDTPCPFIPLPGGPVWAGPPPVGSTNPSGLDSVLAGLAGDPALGGLFMYAANSASVPTTGRVYCVPVVVGGCAWSASANLTASGNTTQSFADMIVEQTGTGGPATRLYVTHSGKVSSLLLSNGGPGWINVVPSPAIRVLSLSPFMNATGNGMTMTCAHPIGGSSGLAQCFDAATGVPVPLTLTPPSFQSAMNSLSLSLKYVAATFLIPGTGTTRMLYPAGTTSDMASPLCYDFSPPGSCTNFTPGWTFASPPLSDYGYAVDPAAPDQCLLGLGDGRRVWRFARDGSFDANGCTQKIVQTLDPKSLFCAFPPKGFAWQSVNIVALPGHGRPPELTGGTITLTDGSGHTVTITVGTANTYQIPTGLVGSGPVTLTFIPQYTGTPQYGYQLQVTFTTFTAPQICYRATVTTCGPVSNTATLTVPEQTDTKTLELGTATGCEPGGGGVLKVCKVAGPGIAVGTLFTFNAGSSTFTVPAGPPPGGTCVIGPSLPAGSNVSVVEAIPAGDTVSGITVVPASQVVNTNLATGSVDVTMGNGVTEVTFTDKRTGYLEICKRGDVKGSATFSVNPGALGPFVVPAGACSPAIEVVAGSVNIHEMSMINGTMAGCSTIPASQQGTCDLNAQTSTVTVSPGDVSAQTIAIITNKPTPAAHVPGGKPTR